MFYTVMSVETKQSGHLNQSYNTLHHDIFISITNFWGSNFPCSTHKLYNNMYIIQKFIYIVMFPNIDMSTDIGPCSDGNLHVKPSTNDVYNNPEIVAQMDETRSEVLLSHSLDHSSTSRTMWIYDLKSNMGRHRLIINQWCELLTDARKPPLMLMDLKVL